MSEPPWFPHLTVAAIIEQDGQFLCVEEHSRHNNVINQPAGHVDENESIEYAVRREVLEETGYEFEPESIVGLYYFKGSNGVSYLRVCFMGKITHQRHNGPIDTDITQIHWLSYAQLTRQKLRHRVVIDCVDDYLANKRFPLDLITALAM